MASKLIDPGEVRPLKARGITAETCEHFGYTVGTYKGKTVQIAPYYDANGQLVAQKVRFADKDFKLLGSLDDALPFGAKAFPKSGRMIVVTEGEIDALSMSQAQGNKWPTVSIACGAGPQVRKYIAKHRDYLLGFEKVVLMFDSDEPGREAAKIAAEVLGGVARIAELPLKDANEMLMADRADELIRAMWNAQPYRPEGIVDIRDLRDEVMQEPQWGLSYPWESMTQLTYGIRLGEITGLGAGVGNGKTDTYLQIIAHLIEQHKVKVGLFYLEQSKGETATRLAGKIAHKTFHVPDSGWTVADKEAALEKLEAAPGVFLYDSFGNNTWETIKNKIEYLYHAEGVQYFFLDHLTALAAWQDDEKKALEQIMSDMGAMVKRLPIHIHYISHLATPEGKPHEEGGRVMARHFKGSRAIIQWSHFLWGGERNQQAESETERTIITMRCLKDRYTGRGLGKTFYLKYDFATGMLHEAGPPGSPSEADEFGFSPEGESKGSPSEF